MTLRTTSFIEIEAAGEQLRQALSGRGVTLHPQSTLAQALDGIKEAVGYWRARIVPTRERSERLVADLAAVEALGSVLVTINGVGSVPGLNERLRAIGGGDPRMTSKGIRSGERDAVFELLCWHVCKHFASDVEFAEPDIRCVYRGHQLGLACKAHYGQPASAIKAIRKGWKQIVGSPVAYGLVMLHMTNQFPHHLMSYEHPGGGALTAGNEATLIALFESHLQAATRPLEERFLADLRAHPRPWERRFHGTLYAAHTVAPLQSLQVRVGGSVYQGMERTPPQDVMSFVQNMNSFWQDLSASGTVPQ